MNNNLVIDNILLLNGIDVIIYPLSLPKLNSNQLNKAIPFALEEYLVHDLSELHFSYVTGEPLQVAVIQKKLLADALKHHTKIKKILPNYLAIPLQKKSWSIINDGQIALIRTGKNSGFCIEVDLLPNILEQAYLETSDNDKPEQIILYENESSIPIQLTNLLHDLLKTKGEKSLTLIEYLTEGLLETPTEINLLTAEFQPKIRLTETKKHWLTSGVLALAAVSLFIVGHLSALLYLSAKSKQQEAAISTAYFSLFPEATSIVAPEWRTAELLKSLQKRHEEHGFLSLVKKLYPAISSHEVLGITFENNQLRLKLKGKNFTELQNLIIMLKNQGLHVDQEKNESDEIQTLDLTLARDK